LGARELRIEVPIGVEPVDAARVLIPVGVCIFDRELRLPQPAEPDEGRRLPDGGGPSLRELPPHLQQGVGPPDDLLALGAVGNGEIRKRGVERGNHRTGVNDRQRRLRGRRYEGGRPGDRINGGAVAEYAMLFSSQVASPPGSIVRGTRAKTPSF
jgi:hypothetical protein